MKKLLLVLVATTTLLLCACDNKSVLNKYVDDIWKQLQKPEEWCYTYELALPRESSNNAYLIDFYVFSGASSYSKWVCVSENGQIDCDCIMKEYFY